MDTTDAKPNIEPALSAEEWTNVLHPQIPRGFPEEPDDVESIADAIASRASYRCDFKDWPQTLALANAALPDDSPYKITRADVAMLGECEIRQQVGGDHTDWDRLDDTRQALAAKLEALLPPQEV